MRRVLATLIVSSLGLSGLILAATGQDSPEKAQDQGKGKAAEREVAFEKGMTGAEHDVIHSLLNDHKSIQRKVEEIPGGVLTRTTTSDPKLVDTVREHVRQMVKHVEQGRPVRLWDPAFRDIFAHAKEITIACEDIEGGIGVVEISGNPEVVPMIRAHARKVDGFVAKGYEAARPPWAGGGMGKGQGKGYGKGQGQGQGQGKGFGKGQGAGKGDERPDKPAPGCCGQGDGPGCCRLDPQGPGAERP